MSYRAWPAAAITGAALAAACVVVGEHVVQANDGCLDSAGWFTATPAAWPSDPDAGAGKRSADPAKPAVGAPQTGQVVGETGDQQDSANQISGCLDLDRIEIPAPGPAPERRA